MKNFISLVTIVFFLNVPMLCIAAGQSIGQPTGKLGNRFFTHPKAKDVFIENNTSTKKKPRYSSYFPIPKHKGKIFTSVKSQKETLSMNKKELATVSDDKSILISIGKNVQK